MPWLRLFSIFLILCVFIGAGPGQAGLPADVARAIGYEQTLNDRVENTEVFESIKARVAVDPRYSPGTQPVFSLKTLLIPAEELDILSVEPLPDTLVVRQDGREYVKFFIHPESEKLFAKLIRKYAAGAEVLATPLASYRSLVAWPATNPETPFGVKVSLDRVIGRARRNIKRKDIRRQVGFAALVRTLDRDELARRGILFVDEPGGVVPKGMDQGYSLRTLPRAEAGVDIVPMFSLYARPKGGGEPLIVRLIRESGLLPEEFIREYLIEPLLQQATYLGVTEGIVGERHEQNMLIELRDGKPTRRFYYRDYGGFGVDTRLRAAAGKKMDFLPTGVHQKDLHASSLVQNEINYVRESNLFALRAAVEPYFPSITAEWISSTFEQSFVSAAKPYLAKEAKTLGELRSGLVELRKGPNAGLDRWRHLEQRVDDHVSDPKLLVGDDLRRLKPEYRPENGRWRDLKSIWIPEDELTIHQLEAELLPAIQDELKKIEGGRTWYRLFIHPESEKLYAELLAKYPAVFEHEWTPLASSRTLFVRSKKNPALWFMPKVSIDKVLTSTNRAVTSHEIANVVGISAYVKLIEGALSEHLFVLPEVFGMIPNGWDKGGQILRLIPERVARGETTLVPLFSLPTETSSGTLIESLARKAGMSPAEFVRLRIIRPFAAGFADWAVRGSIVFENHAENVLLELGADGLPTGRFAVRDLLGANLNTSSATFKKLGEGLKKEFPFQRSFNKDYYQDASKDAEVSSLASYFKGGFLYDVNRLLKRIEPGYRQGDIYKVLWQETGRALEKVTGLPPRSLAHENLEANMATVLAKARRRVAQTLNPNEISCSALLLRRSLGK